MPQPGEFIVDLLDKEDIKAKLPLAEQVLADKEKAAHAAAIEVEIWRGTVTHLRNLASGGSASAAAEGSPGPSLNGGSAPPQAKGRMQQAVVMVVEHVDMPMRPQEVADRLGQANFPYASVAAVNSALYSAWQNGLLSKAGKGLYAPRDYTDGEIYRGEKEV
ncbi:MAG: hypothetical protein ABR613_09005 [Actinomycetota bacterium]